MKNPETILTNRIVSTLEGFGCLVFKIHGSQYQAAGLPDLLIHRGSKTVWIEVKTQTGRLRPVQEARISQIRRYGVPVAVCRSVEAALEFVSDHLPTAGAIE
jgi:Holliday junction resolvase